MSHSVHGIRIAMDGLRHSLALFLATVAALYLLTGNAFAAPDEKNRLAYRLGAGDKVKVSVFGEKDLSGTFELDGEGDISMPLIGQVKAGRETLRGVESLLVGKLRKYLKTPQVSVEVLNYRPFYILGEIKKPGNYPYVAGISILNAVAMAGGFTYRADKDDITIKRASTPEDKPQPVNVQAIVLPGDIITIDERFF